MNIILRPRVVDGDTVYSESESVPALMLTSADLRQLTPLRCRKFKNKIAGWHRIDRVMWYSSTRPASCTTPTRSCKHGGERDHGDQSAGLAVIYGSFAHPGWPKRIGRCRALDGPQQLPSPKGVCDEFSEARVMSPVVVVRLFTVGHSATSQCELLQWTLNALPMCFWLDFSAAVHVTYYLRVWYQLIKKKQEFITIDSHIQRSIIWNCKFSCKAHCHNADVLRT